MDLNSKKYLRLNIKIVPKERRLPKTWEEFCKINSRINNGYFITADSLISEVHGISRRADLDKNVCPSKEIAEGILALIQLIQLRDYYNDGWKPTGYCSAIYITNNSDPWIGVITVDSKSPLAFKSADLAKEFANNFRDLIDKVKYLF